MENVKRKFAIVMVCVVALQSYFGLVANAAGAGSVVINEVAWMGTLDGTNDEWIELYNTTSGAVDLSGWVIEDDGVASILIESGVIAPHGYFLIEDAEEVLSVNSDVVLGLSLANAGDSLVLKDDSGAVIDSVNSSGGAWAAGDSVSKATMERVDPLADNWETCVSGNGALGRNGGAILGTPAGVNSVYGGGGPEVYFVTESSVLESGGQLTLGVEVSNAVDLYAYGLEINYDPAILSYHSAYEDDFLRADGAATAFNAALEDGVEGVLIVGNARLENPPTGLDGTEKLFDLFFDVVGSDGDEGSLSFGGGSYLSDTFGATPAGFRVWDYYVGEVSSDPVSNLVIAEGTARYSLELSWAGSADSYLIEKQGVDGNFYLIGAVAEKSFVDSGSLIAGVNYIYQVIAVTGGAESAPLQLSGFDSRGILGDLDRSDRVDGKDLEKLARSYGSGIGDEEYNSLNDTNYDGVVDGSDLIDIGVNFGMTY